MTEPSSGPIQVSFWGTRGSISTPGRATEKYGGNTPCVSVEYGDTIIIIDAGTGIRNLGIDLMDRINQSGPLKLHLILSHTHWDHIQGLPFFLPAYSPDVTLRIYGTARGGAFLEAVLQGQMDEDYFPVSMQSLAAKVSVQEMTGPTVRIGDMRVDWQDQIYHPGGCARYKFTAGGRQVVYASDVELNKVLGPTNQAPEKQAHLQEYLDFVQGVDLLIGDGQYTTEEYQTKAGFGHTTIPSLIELARLAKVKQLAIFHHDPQHSDSFLDEYFHELTADHEEADPLNFFWAREGVTLPV